MAVTRSPWALLAPAGEVVRRQSAPASAPPGYFADISSCVKGERRFRINVHAMNRPRAGVAHTNAGGSDGMKSISTDQVPRETSMKVPTAQLLAANGSAPHQRATFRHTPASAKRVKVEGNVIEVRDDVRTLRPRMTPTPTPLAIPLKRLFRAHGISPTRCRSS
jgi:hypothetical protein